MRMTAPALSVATIGLAVALVWYVRPQPESSVVPEAAEAPAPAERVANRTPPQIMDPAPPADSPASAPIAESAAAPRPARHRCPVRRQRPMAQLLKELQQMPSFAQMPGLKLIDIQVECRSTMCRLQLTQPPEPRGQGGALAFNFLRDGAAP